MIDYPIRLPHVLFTVPVPSVRAPCLVGSGGVFLHPMLFFFISCLWGDIYALPPDIETKNRGRKDGRPYTHEDRCHSLAEIPAAASAPHFQVAAQSRRIKRARRRCFSHRRRVFFKEQYMRPDISTPAGRISAALSARTSPHHPTLPRVLLMDSGFGLHDRRRKHIEADLPSLTCALWKSRRRPVWPGM